MLFQFLLVVHAIIAAMLVGVILVQKSEGGGLGMGGSPSGLMSARGAADFLTRATTILATLFIAFSIVLAVLAARGHTAKIDTSLARGTQAPAAQLPVPNAPADDSGAPFSSAAKQAIGNGAAPAANTVAPADNNSVPLAK
jgi:preprotein translocase subunit SecG